MQTAESHTGMSNAIFRVSQRAVAVGVRVGGVFDVLDVRGVWRALDSQRRCGTEIFGKEVQVHAEGGRELLRDPGGVT